MINGDGDITFGEVAGEWEEMRNQISVGQPGVPYTPTAKGMAGWLWPRGEGRIRYFEFLAF